MGIKGQAFRNKIDWKLAAVLLIAVLSRSVLLGQYPGGIHADEAFAGYEAYAMANFGMDSWGYRNPVYLTVWGSGMSALESYLMMPFVSVWGLNTVTVRIPQMLLGIVSVYVFYLLLKRAAGQKTAYWGALLLAVSPWHIMMSRYGMDCNLGPGFVLLGIYFAVCGIEKERYLPLSAVFWGLSLYAYAVNWLFVPIFLISCLVYCMVHKKIKVSWSLVGAGVIVFLSAVPLLLFVAVNEGMLPEIRGGLLSIPRMVVYRGSEISLGNIPANIVKLAKMLVTQNDYLLWNSIKGFGIYYIYSTPFMAYGFYLVLRQCIRDWKQRRFGYGFIVLLWFLAGVLTALLQGVGFNRMNMLLPVLFLFLAEGICSLCGRFGKKLTYAFAGVYMVSFLAFEAYYFSAYQQQISKLQNAGAGEAIAFALSAADGGGDIYIANSIRHSQVLFYTQYPVQVYMETVERSMEDGLRDAYVHRFGQFCWDWEKEQAQEGIYIIPAQDSQEYEERGYEVSVFDACAVAIKN